MNTKSPDIKRKRYIEFLVRCGLNEDDLSAEAWRLFKHFRYNSFIAPMVIEDSKTLTRGQLSIKYGVNRRVIRYIIDMHKQKNM